MYVTKRDRRRFGITDTAKCYHSPVRIAISQSCDKLEASPIATYELVHNPSTPISRGTALTRELQHLLGFINAKKDLELCLDHDKVKDKQLTCVLYSYRLSTARADTCVTRNAYY